MWECTPLILVLGIQKQTDLYEFKTSQSYIVRPVSKRNEEREGGRGKGRGR